MLWPKLENRRKCDAQHDCKGGQKYLGFLKFSQMLRANLILGSFLLCGRIQPIHRLYIFSNICVKCFRPTVNVLRPDLKVAECIQNYRSVRKFKQKMFKIIFEYKVFFLINIFEKKPSWAKKELQSDFQTYRAVNSVIRVLFCLFIDLYNIQPD